MSNFSNVELSLTCPKCKAKFKVRLSKMTNGSVMNCPSCKSKITFTGDGANKAKKALEEIEKAFKH